MRKIYLLFIMFATVVFYVQTAKAELSAQPDWVCAKDICFDDHSISANNPMAYVTTLITNELGRSKKVDLSLDPVRFVAKHVGLVDIVHLDINCFTKKIYAPSGYKPIPYRFGGDQFAPLVCARAGLFKTKR